jgi:choline dehydrogenase
MPDPQAEYIVVGAGTTGCIIAARLAEGRRRVLLLEAGDSDSNPLFRIPGLGFAVTMDSRYNWMFRTEPIEGMNGRQLTLMQGRVVGGSSSINGMQYHRGHPQEYALWQQLGCEGWGPDDVVPYFRKVEARLTGATESGAGKIPLERSRPELRVLDAFLESAAALGYPALEDLATKSVEGFGYCHTNIVHGRRVSAAAAYLKPALDGGYITLMKRTQAVRVIFENGRAAGVEAIRRGEKVIVRASAEVVVCAGSIKSPHLLLLSGIGPRDQLAKFGIDVVVDAPRVGKNLQNHPLFPMRFSCEAPVTAYKYLKPLAALGAALQYALRRRGPLADSTYAASGFLHSQSNGNSVIPDLQVVLAGALTPSPAQMKPGVFGMLPRQHGFIAAIFPGTPHSTGEISLNSAAGLDRPRIEPGYFSDHRDVDVLIDGIRQVRHIANGAPMLELGVREITPGADIRDDRALETAIRQSGATGFHQCGTCAMGGDIHSVVDPQLRVRGVAGLRVADASIIPRVPNAGLHGPTLMVGERAADLIGRG